MNNNTTNEKVTTKKSTEEKVLNLNPSGGIAAIFLIILGIIVDIAGIIAIIANSSSVPLNAVSAILAITIFIVLCICFGGIKTVKPNEARVLTLFGKYIGSIKTPGTYFVNPFCSSAKPTSTAQDPSGISLNISENSTNANLSAEALNPSISLKAVTLKNQKQKINDLMGNPIEIGIVVIWRVVDTAKAIFDVDNYKEFVSIQADSALRNVTRMFPYDSEEDNVPSLRNASTEVAEILEKDLQQRVEIAGIEIVEARITHLAYAPEIAAAMLQRQQASAIIDARQKIVDGAVGMVEMALKKLQESGCCELDEERKAAMVSNLLVVLCGNKDATPVVNSGSLY